MRINSLRRKIATGIAAVGLASALLASGCSTTVESQLCEANCWFWGNQ